MKARLKIGIEVQRIFRSKKHGMEVVALEIIRELQKIDLHNEYIIYARTDTDTGCLQQTDNFTIKSLPAKSYFTWEQIVLPEEVKKDKLDFLHSTCNTSALFLDIPLILTLHDIIYLEKLDFKGTPYQNFGNIYRRIVVPKVVRKSANVITVSNYEKNVILNKFPIPDERVNVIYNGVSSNFNVLYSQQSLNEFQQEHNLPKQFILFLGNTAPKKNTSNVLKAYLAYIIEADNGLPLVILDYQRDLVVNFLRKEGKLEYIDSFIFPGYIPSGKMPLLYNSSTLFLYPSLRESFGLPIIEAMACGVPVITSNTSCMPEIAEDAALLVDPLSYINLKDMVVLLLSDTALQQDLIQKGLARAKAFTWKAAAQKLLSIYTSANIARK
jgi:glycosyltransferase involved in cell wall biosynthesis